MPIPQIFNAFDCVLPDHLANETIDNLLPLLKVVIDRKIAKRQKRNDINTIQDVLDLLKKSKNIMVLTGAGMYFWYFLCLGLTVLNLKLTNT